LLALHGDWIDPDYKQLPRQTVDTWLEQKGGARPTAGRGHPRRFLQMLDAYKQGLLFFNEFTYSGAPAGASAEIGERILDTLAGHAAAASSELLDGEIGPEDCHSPIWKMRFLFLNPWAIRLTNRFFGFRNQIA
jgi:hypothetical protein